MQALLDSNVSWFNFLGMSIGNMFDALIVFLFGFAGLLFVAMKDLLKWCIEWLWDASLDWTAEQLTLLLNSLGFADDIDVEEIREWLELVNIFLPVKESLAWLEAYWAYRLAKYAFKAFMWLNPGQSKAARRR